jgi:hypothetical protein
VDTLSFLLGTWRGTGHQEYPTVEPADYEEELRFSHAGEAFLTYVQQAWAPADGATLHAESGFWRVTESGRLEVCLAHPLGLTEISEGAVDGRHIVLRSRTIARTETGEPVAEIRRRYVIEGETMRYELAMALDHVPLTHHLRATLTRA